MSRLWSFPLGLVLSWEHVAAWMWHVCLCIHPCCMLNLAVLIRKKETGPALKAGLPCEGEPFPLLKWNLRTKLPASERGRQFGYPVCLPLSPWVGFCWLAWSGHYSFSSPHPQRGSHPLRREIVFNPIHAIHWSASSSLWVFRGPSMVLVPGL